jgi:hypothetical protein
VVITHKFSAGEVYEEHAQFRQEPELIQEKWSWKESKHGRSQREFAVDFMAGAAFSPSLIREVSGSSLRRLS